MGRDHRERAVGAPMTQQDYDPFVGEFRRLSAALNRFKQTPVEVGQKADAYFQVLKKLPLFVVVQKADAWMETQSKFPSPAQWKTQVVKTHVEIPTLTDAESREQLRAEQLHYEEPDPCDCRECAVAGLPDRAENRSRYVPIEDADGHCLKAKNAITGQIVTPGEWLHGFPLIRWYKARADFWATAYAKVGITDRQQHDLAKLPFGRRIARLLSVAESSKRNLREVVETVEPVEPAAPRGADPAV